MYWSTVLQLITVIWNLIPICKKIRKWCEAIWNLLKYLILHTVLFSYAQLKGMKISEGISNLAASSKKRTESLTLNISTYLKGNFLFLRIRPNWKHLLKFSHLCLLRKPQQAAQLLATQNPPWKSLFLLKMLQKPQTTKWHVHDKAKTLANSRFSPNSSLFSLFLSCHNMYLGTRYSLSQWGQNHYDVVQGMR